MNVPPLFLYLSQNRRQKRLYTKATQRGALAKEHQHQHHHHRAFSSSSAFPVLSREKRDFCIERERRILHWIFEIPFLCSLLDFEIAFESTHHLSLSLSLSRRPIENNASGGDLYRESSRNTASRETNTHIYIHRFSKRTKKRRGCVTRLSNFRHI